MPLRASASGWRWRIAHARNEPVPVPRIPQPARSPARRERRQRSQPGERKTAPSPIPESMPLQGPASDRESARLYIMSSRCSRSLPPPPESPPLSHASVSRRTPLALEEPRQVAIPAGKRNPGRVGSSGDFLLTGARVGSWHRAWHSRRTRLCADASRRVRLRRECRPRTQRAFP